MKTLRAALFAACLAFTVVFAAPSASAAPTHPATRVVLDRPMASDHPEYAPCTDTYHVYLGYSQRDHVGDNSITTWVTIQWYEDNTPQKGYCGYIAARTWFSSNDCFGLGAEHLTYVVDELFKDDGTFLGGFGNTTDLLAGCNSGTTLVTSKIFVACGTTVRPWGNWLEENNTGAETDFGRPANADGEDVGGYGLTHTICVN